MRARGRREDSILFLDEIDGLLRTRAGAQRGWEVSQVNEILRQMEAFGGILACATNFSDNLDPAALRRFTFKLEFDYLWTPRPSMSGITHCGKCAGGMETTQNQDVWFLNIKKRR